MSYAHNNIFTGEITDDEEVWLGDEGIMEEFILDETCTSECEVGEESEDSTMCALSRWLLVFLVHLQAQFHLSDGILGALLRFLKAFFRVLGRFSSLCAGITQNVPSSLYKLSHSYGPLRNSFRRYVVCKKCHSISIKIVEGCGNHLRSKCCSYQAFPNHRQCQMRAACATPLLKSVELASQRKILYPFMTYCYFGLECSLQSLLLIPGLALACEQWRSRCTTA